MAAGDTTDKITDLHVDYGRNQVTMQITTLIEAKDGTLYSIGQRTETKDYQDTATIDAKPVSVLKVDLTPKDAGNPQLG